MADKHIFCYSQHTFSVCLTYMLCIRNVYVCTHNKHYPRLDGYDVRECDYYVICITPPTV